MMMNPLLLLLKNLYMLQKQVGPYKIIFTYWRSPVALSTFYHSSLLLLLVTNLTHHYYHYLLSTKHKKLLFRKKMCYTKS